MSDVERRQARQRAFTLGACAAAFAIGGPFIASRIADHKTQEAYLAGARAFALNSPEPETIRPVSLTNSAREGAGLIEAAYRTDAPAAGLVGDLNFRTRDSQSLSGLVAFTLEDLGARLHRPKEDGLDCLAKAVYYEARSEDTVGQMAVAEVVMNRVKDPNFPKTVCGVVYEGSWRVTGCQFTFTCDGSLAHRPAGEAWDRAKSVALHVLLGLNQPVTHHATHYHTDYVNPYWSAGMVETDVIGSHIFYRFPRTRSEISIARAAIDAQRERNSDTLQTLAEIEPRAALLPVSAQALGADDAQPL